MQDERWRHESGDADGHAAVHPEDQTTQGPGFWDRGGYRNFICLFCIWEAKNDFMAAHDEFEVLERHGCDLHVAKELRLRPDVGNLGKV